jgi:hypothetical protein
MSHSSIVQFTLFSIGPSEGTPFVVSGQSPEGRFTAALFFSTYEAAGQAMTARCGAIVHLLDRYGLRRQLQRCQAAGCNAIMLDKDLIFIDGLLASIETIPESN